MQDTETPRGENRGSGEAYEIPSLARLRGDPPCGCRGEDSGIDKDSTTIIDGAGKKKDIEGRIGQMKAQIEETTSGYDKEKLQERLAKLSGGVVIIRVGGGGGMDY